MRDSLDPSTADPRKAFLLANVYPSDPREAAATVGRPGFQQSGDVLTAHKVQGIAQYTKLDGTEITLAFVNGGMYRFTWTTRTWSNVVLVGVTLSTTNPVYGVNFANTLVVSDGVNTPFTWDGTTFVSLTNAPVFYGKPTVYYAKLFGIQASDRTTMMWSEENDPTTGYASGGFNNAWQLGQTDQEALTALVGTNDALFYFRARSSGYISGAVNTDFVSSGTREGVDETIGTVSPGAVVYYERKVYFLSADGRPYAIILGGGLQPLWQDLRETLATVARDALSLSLGVADPLTEMVLLGIPVQAQTAPETFAAIDTRTQFIGGLWNGFQPTALALVKDDNLVPRIMHGTVNGYVYDHGDPDGTLWQDANSTADGGTLPIQHAVQGTPLGFDLKYEKVFDRIDISERLTTDLTTVQVDYETPRGISTAQSLNFSAAGTFAQWDIAVWDVDFWAPDELERHFSLGLSGRGRWIMLRIRHSYGTERFGLVGWQVTSFMDAADPGIP
jgi:hypothetical protein